MALRQLKKLKLTFCPSGDKGVRAAQDLFNRVGNAKARASNPDCDVDIDMVGNPNYAARLQVVFANDEEETIFLADKSSQSVLDYIRSKTEQKLNTAKLEQAGFKGQKLSSTWHG